MEIGLTHPTPEMLRALALGKLDDATAASVTSHVNSCLDCRKAAAHAAGAPNVGVDAATPLPPALPETLQKAPPSPAAPSPAAPSPGGPALQVPGYEILRELGRGGMGVVYLAKNVLMDRREVLKVVKKSILDEPGVAERFLREIRSAAMLNHHNVVKAYSAVQAGESLLFAMEYVDGEDLDKVVQRQGPLPIPHACHYVSQAALGLQHAHEQKLVHRDIKPQNLILARQGKKHTVKVLDFGLAKATREGGAAADLTGVGAMMGTPAYMAPEQAEDAASADIRADIYSLGCTLYFLLTGRPPFAGKNVIAILHAHIATEPTPLDRLRADAPAELATVVAKMTAKEPARRYQTPIEAAKALAPFVKAGLLAPGAPVDKAAAEKSATVELIYPIDLLPPAPGKAAVQKRISQPPAVPSIFNHPTVIGQGSKPQAASDMPAAGKTSMPVAISPAPAKRPMQRKDDAKAPAPAKKVGAGPARPAAKKGRKIWLMAAASIGVVLMLAAGEVWLWNGGTFPALSLPGVPFAEQQPPKPATPAKPGDRPQPGDGGDPSPHPTPAPPDGGGDQPPPVIPPPNTPVPTEAEAVAAIEAIKGSVQRDQDGHVDDVDLSNCGAKDSDLSYVRAFPKLRILDLIGGEITDAGLANLAETPALEELDLYQDKVTGRGIQVLGSLPHLNWLNLTVANEAFSAADFQVLGKCKELKHLEITINTNADRLPGEWLRFLGDLPRLASLELSDAGVTDEYLEYVVACKSIEDLNLQRDLIAGSSLKKLSQLPRLSTLNLYDVQTLSDDDLKNLRECSQLTAVDVSGAEITEQGVMNLMLLPNLKTITLGKGALTEKVKEAFQKDRPEIQFDVFGD